MESYEIRFWIQKPDGYWEQRDEVFITPGKEPKAEHLVAEKMWEEKYKDHNTRHVYTSYQ